MTFAAARKPDVDVNALRVPLAHASLFGRLVSETNHQKGTSHEALVKVRIDDGLSCFLTGVPVPPRRPTYRCAEKKAHCEPDTSVGVLTLLRLE